MPPQAAASQAAEGQHKHTNRLAKEQSPYLLQHAHNPVSNCNPCACLTLGRLVGVSVVSITCTDFCHCGPCTSSLSTQGV